MTLVANREGRAAGKPVGGVNVRLSGASQRNGAPGSAAGGGPSRAASFKPDKCAVRAPLSRQGWSSPNFGFSSSVCLIRSGRACSRMCTASSGLGKSGSGLPGWLLNVPFVTSFRSLPAAEGLLYHQIWAPHTLLQTCCVTTRRSGVLYILRKLFPQFRGQHSYVHLPGRTRSSEQWGAVLGGPMAVSGGVKIWIQRPSCSPGRAVRVFCNP